MIFLIFIDINRSSWCYKKSHSLVVTSMIDADNFRDLAPNSPTVLYSSDHVISGIPIPKTKRIEIFSPNEWEEFTEEWAFSHKSEYFKIARFAGSGDKGLDVVGFIGGPSFADGWDNYQCKHYGKVLNPSDIWVEIGKIVYYSFTDEYPPPRKYYFVSPKGVGTKLAMFLASPEHLRKEARNNWVSHCQDGITSTMSVPLTGAILTYFEQFDFSIFSYKTSVELIAEHSKTTFHAVRFGGGLGNRPPVATPPDEIDSSESRYIQQIFEAYTDHTNYSISDESCLNAKPELKNDFVRQRERFYSAESLRNFSRDTVPAGTFEALQEEVFQGVVDVCESNHADGLVRMRNTITQSAQLSLVANPLSSVMKVQDRQGICHQLANTDRLTWVKNDAD